MSSTQSTVKVPRYNSVWTPVSNEHVHKLAAHEVLLSQWCLTGADSYMVSANWPAQHIFYDTRAGLHDPLLLVESVRQCVPLLSHLAYDAPMDHRQSWSSLAFALSPTALASTSETTEVELHIDCKEVTRRGSRLSSVNMEVDVVRDGVRVGSAHTRYANHAPALYQRIRGEYADVHRAMERAIPLAPPVAPAQVGRDDFGDVVLSPTDSKTRHQLRVDLNHPVLFDHAVDHAPGMLLVEAARQAAQSMAHPEPMITTSMEAVFTRYVELDAPCWFHAEVLPSRDTGKKILVTAVQDNICVFSSLIGLDSIPSS